MSGIKDVFTASTRDRRISVCTDCRAGIFPNHKYKWTSRGLIHIDCKHKAGT